MIKSFQRRQSEAKNCKEKYKKPQRTQHLIPISKVWEDGIFLSGNRIYSKTFLFTDINYLMSDNSAKESVLTKYSDILNSLDPNAEWKITVMSRIRSDTEVENNILLPYANDELQKYRNEVNSMLINKLHTSSPYEINHYITCSTAKNNINDARDYFEQLTRSLSMSFKNLGSRLISLDEVSRLKVYHDFFRPDETEQWHYEPSQRIKLGNSFKNFIAPYNFTPHNSYFEFSNQFGRSLIITEFPNYMKDDFIKKLCDKKINFCFSVDIIPIPKNEAVELGDNRELRIDSKISSYNRRQIKNNNYNSEIPSNLKNERKAVTEYIEDVNERDENLYMCAINIVHTADSPEELNKDTAGIKDTAREFFLKAETAMLKSRQIDCLRTVLPFNVPYIQREYIGLMTEGLSSFVPFSSQDIIHKDGTYFGTNAVSGNIIKIDRMNLQNGNCWILGDSGGGKSFAMKTQISQLRLLGSAKENVDVIVIDPEREYCHLTKSMGGTIATISVTSQTHINPFDINAEYGNDDFDKGDPIRTKSTFILSVIEQILIDEGGINSTIRGIIDRAIRMIYEPLKNNGFKGEMPTLKDFVEELKAMNDPDATRLAKQLDIYTYGSLDLFAHQSNVDINSSMLCYDIHSLDSQLENLALIIILDSILNRISANRKKGRTTYIIIDEIYLLFNNPYSLNFLEKLWLRIRKYNGFATALIQNVSKLEDNDKAMSMLSNSELTIMLKQSEKDANVLANLYNISENQVEYLKTADQGTGLIRVGRHLVHFENLYPEDTELYKLMSTKPKEQMIYYDS